MADETNSNVLFSAEYDNSKFHAGITENINDLRALAAEQKRLQDACNETEKKLSDVGRSLEAVNTDINNLDKSSEDYVKTQEQLKQRAADLTKQYEALDSELKDQKKELDTVTQSNLKVAESFKAIADTVNKNPITPKVNNAELTKFITNTRTQLSTMFRNFDFTNFETLKQQIKGNEAEIRTFISLIEEAKSTLQTLDPNTQEFKDLTQVVDNANQVITAFNEITEQTETKNVSLRTRLKQLRDELTALEDAGKDNTVQYQQLQLEAARLTDQYGDMQQRIRILASDTRNLDFGLAALQTAATGFQTITGAMELFGLSNEDAAEAQRKLLAIMNLVQGMQQLQNLLLKESVLRTVGAQIATNAYAATQRFLAATLGTTTTAVRGLSVALLTTGIGALVVGIGFLISALSDWADESDETAAANERLKTSVDGLNASLDRNLGFLSDAKDVALANAKLRGDSAEQLYTIERDFREREISNLQTTNVQRKILYNQAVRDGEASAEEINKLAADANAADVELKKKRHELLMFDLQFQIETNNKSLEEQKRYTDERDKLLKDAMSIEEQVRLELSLFGKTDEERELAELKNKYTKDKAVLESALRDTTQLTELYNKNKLAIEVRYDNMRIEEQQRILQEIENLNFDAAARRIENLQNEFDRERETILLESAKTRDELQQQLNAQINNVQVLQAAKILTPEQAQEAIDNINSVFDTLFDQLGIRTDNRLRELAAKVFQEGLQIIETNTATQLSNISISASKEITDVANLYSQGKLSYEEYQKELTRITEEETLKRLQATRIQILVEIDQIRSRLTNTALTQGEQSQLQQQLQAFLEQLANIDQDIAQNQADKDKDAEDANQEHLNRMLAAYSQFSDAILGFINQLDRAESQRLERQISYQERRVAFARQMAERGNAEYLEMEEKRLDELQRQQEAHATKQMAIDAAMTASKAILAAVSAIASAAGENWTLVLPAVAAVVGALAAAYSFVASFKAPVQTFAEGTEYAQLNGNRSGIDTIPAMINEGERVVPTDTNRQYFKALSAIQHKAIPPEVINKFVDVYTFDKVPAHDYARLSQATDAYYFSQQQAQSNQQLGAIHEQLLHLNENLDGADNLNITMDEHGFALSINKTLKKMKLLKRG